MKSQDPTEIILQIIKALIIAIIGFLIIRALLQAAS